MNNQQGPLVQHMELCSVLVAAWVGGELRGEWVYEYVWLGALAVHVKLSQHC